MRDATVRGETIFELPEAQAQAQQFLTLIHEMLNRGSKRKDQTLNPLPDEEDLWEGSKWLRQHEGFPIISRWTCRTRRPVDRGFSR